MSYNVLQCLKMTYNPHNLCPGNAMIALGPFPPLPSYNWNKTVTSLLTTLAGSRNPPNSPVGVGSSHMVFLHNTSSPSHPG